MQRARARNDTKKRKNNQSLNDALFINRTLFAKATLLPSAAAVKEEAAIVEDDVVKSEENEARDLFKRFFACISSPKRFFFRGPETQEKRGKRRSFFSLFRKRMSPNPKEEGANALFLHFFHANL